jgi:hypothetical protein
MLTQKMSSGIRACCHLLIRVARNRSHRFLEMLVFGLSVPRAAPDQFWCCNRKYFKSIIRLPLSSS